MSMPAKPGSGVYRICAPSTATVPLAGARPAAAPACATLSGSPSGSVSLARTSIGTAVSTPVVAASFTATGGRLSVMSNRCACPTSVPSVSSLGRADQRPVAGERDGQAENVAARYRRVVEGLQQRAGGRRRTDAPRSAFLLTISTV